LRRHCIRGIAVDAPSAPNHGRHRELCAATLPAKVDIGRILTEGGRQRIALLRFCVMSVQMEPVFVFLTQEYHFQPTHDAALALYDVFCAPDAPARIYAPDVLPPRDLRVLTMIRLVRQQSVQMKQPEQQELDAEVRISTPQRYLFDLIARAVQDDPNGGFARLSDRFDPHMSPVQNLPDGRMNAGQRYFLNNVWLPIVRPRLVSAGFWRVATIG